MKRIPFASGLFVLVAGLLTGVAAFAADWTVYRDQAYSFSMLMPAGTKFSTREYGGGWGGMTANFEGVRFHGIAKLGRKESDADIEAYALRTIGIPAGAWTKVDQGTNQRGWERYYTFRANVGAKLIFGAYGVGPQGNYLVYLETTPTDFSENRADYDKWYVSVRLD